MQPATPKGPRTGKKNRKGRSMRPLGLEPLEERALPAVTIGANLSAGAQLTTYRLALATTAEFTTLAGDATLAQTALTNLVAETNKVYGPELGIRFQLIPNNNLLTFTNPATDGYTNGVDATMLAENAAAIAAAGVAATDYDIAHVIGSLPPNQGAAGRGQLGSIGTSEKARGATNTSAIDGTLLSVFLHEIGHQLGADHPFNGVLASCTERVANNSYEPGSGSTIMAYQGTCAGDNLTVLPGDENYFHSASFDQIRRTLDAIPLVGTRSATVNSVPTINAGADVTIPASTPFTLTATGNDADAADRLTYTWEQIDLGGAVGQSVPIPNAADTVGPLFRSFAPSADPSRTFPRLADILANTAQATNKDEHLPTQSRTLSFRATARDNHVATISGQSLAVGGVNSDDVVVTVVNTGAPFRMTNLNAAATLTGGAMQSFTWDVAGTTANGINAANVRILLSTDGGNTFPLLLATTANDGSHDLALPNISAANARIKIQGDGNVFFDINDANLTLNANTGAPGLTVVETNSRTQVREGQLTLVPATDTYTIALNSAPAAPVQVTVTANAQSQISLDGTTFAATQVLTLNNTTPSTITVRAAEDAAPEGLHTSTIGHAITASTDPNYPTSLIINTVTVQISDDELPPVVGVDFQPSTILPTPTNWTAFTDPIFQATTRNDLLREDGITTPYDLTVTPIPTANVNFASSIAPIDGPTIPQHHPSLAGADVSVSWGLQDFVPPMTVEAVWSGLAAGATYRIYVLVDNLPITQSVTITGATTLPTIDQVPMPGALQINGERGDSSRSLESYARTVAADANGRISISIVSIFANPNDVHLSALAIQEAPAAVPGVTITQTGGNTQVAEQGETTDTYTVALRTAPTADVTITVAPAAGNDVTVTPSTLTFTPQNFATPQTVTVKAVDDAQPEGTETVAIGHTAVSADLAYNGVLIDSVMASVLDNDAAAGAADDFNRGNDTALGANWSHAAGAFVIQNNRAMVMAANGAAEATLNGSNTVETDGVAVEADIDITGTLGHIGLMVRASADFMNQYLGAISFDGSFAIAQIWKRVGGTWTNLTYQFLPNAPRTGKLRFEATQFQLILRLDGTALTFTFDRDLPETNPNDLVGIRGTKNVLYDNFKAEAINLTKAALPDTDNFTGANGANLAPKWFPRFDRFAIQGDKARAENVLFGRSVATLNTTQRERNVIVEADLALNTTVPLTHAGVIARYRGTQDSGMYLGAIVYDAARSPVEERFRGQIWVNDGINWRNLVDNRIATPANGVGRVSFQVHDSLLRLSFNGVVVGSTSDTTINDAGWLGIRGVSGETFDNFSAAVSNTAPTVAGLTIASGDFSAAAGTITANLNNSLAFNTVAINPIITSATVTLPAGVSAAGLILRYSGPGDTNWYWGALVDTGAGVQLQIYKNVNGVITQLAAQNATLAANRTGDLNFSINGNALTLQLGTSPALMFTDPNGNALPTGGGGIRGTAGTTYQNVTVF